MRGTGWAEQPDEAGAQKLARLDSHTPNIALDPREAAQAEGERLRHVIDETNRIQQLEAEAAGLASAGAGVHRQRLRTAGARRALHAKPHLSLATARFEVADSLPEWLHSEFFQPGATHAACVRFSSAASGWSSDRQRGVHGLAVRLLHSEPRSSSPEFSSPEFSSPESSGSADDGGGAQRMQDLLATNGPTSHARNAEDFITSMRVLAKRPTTFRRLLGLLRLATLPRALGGGGLAGPRMAWLLLRGAGRIDSLSTQTYWSRTPYALGDAGGGEGEGGIALKFRFVPRQGEDSLSWAFTGPNRLREELLKRLRLGDVVFELQVQLFVDEHRTPIEDATVPWPSGDDEFTSVGRLVIPNPAEGSLAEQEATVEDCAFNPWNRAADFRPLGELNRARRHVYRASADLRHGRRSVAAEPVSQRVGLWLAEKVFALLNRFVPWHRLPPLPGLANLAAIRNRARRENMLATPGIPLQEQPEVASRDARHRWRSADGSHNDLLEPQVGRASTPFARNMSVVESPRILDPNPMEISRRLLRRDRFLPVEGLNYFVPAWTQFQVHDWMGHRVASTDEREADELIHVEDTDAAGEGLARMSPVPTTQAEVNDRAAYPGAPPVFDNIQSHWWDASQLYGASDERQAALRRRADGSLGSRLPVGDDGLLATDPEMRNQVDLTGANRGYWLGLSLLHTLFSREHNAICDALEAAYPARRDDHEWLFQIARLINAALIAKIHTLEWSRAVLNTATLDVAFRTYWEGIGGQQPSDSLARLGKLLPDDVWRGLPGSATHHFGMPFAQTEEFVSCYRMHSMLRDELAVHATDGRGVIGSIRLRDKIGQGARHAMLNYGPEALIYSFGLAPPGRLCLGNFPEDMRRLTMEVEDEPPVDLGALDIIRDRERQIPRYNAFRAALGLPRCKNFKEISDDPRWQRELASVYRGKIEDVDLMIGMLAERAPEGFGFSETAFRIFIVNAAQRFHSDRFYTTDFNAEVYTELGMDWIADNGFASVLLRHYPNLRGAINPENPFHSWSPLPGTLSGAAPQAPGEVDR